MQYLRCEAFQHQCSCGPWTDKECVLQSMLVPPFSVRSGVRTSESWVEAAWIWEGGWGELLGCIIIRKYQKLYRMHINKIIPTLVSLICVYKVAQVYVATQEIKTPSRCRVVLESLEFSRLWHKHDLKHDPIFRQVLNVDKENPNKQMRQKKL